MSVAQGGVQYYLPPDKQFSDVNPVGFTIEMVRQLFINSVGKHLYDESEQGQITYWFISETNCGKLLLTGYHCDSSTKSIHIQDIRPPNEDDIFLHGRWWNS